MTTSPTIHPSTLDIPASRARTETAAHVSFGAGATFIALLAALHAIKPELDPSWSPISEYALGAHGWVMTAAFLALSTSGVALFVALRACVRTRGGRVGRRLLLLGAIGPLLAALFEMDPLSIPDGAATTSGALHSTGAMLADAFLIAGLLLARSLVPNDPAWARFRIPLHAATALAWANALILTASLAILLPRHGGHLGPEVTIGWQGRLCIASYALWLMTTAWCVSRVAKSGR